MVSIRWRIVLLVIVVALISGGAGFYFGIGKGAEVIGTIASQNRVYEALGDVRRSMTALESSDVAETGGGVHFLLMSMHRKAHPDSSFRR